MQKNMPRKKRPSMPAKKAKNDPGTDLSITKRPQNTSIGNTDNRGYEAQLKTLNKQLEKKIAELTAEVQQQKNKFRTFAINVDALFSYVDSNQFYQYVNRDYEKLFKKPANFIVGKTVKQLLGPQDYEIVRPHIETVLSGKEVSYEADFEFDDGLHAMQVKYLPDRDSEGNISGFFTFVLDLTKHKRIEKALDESRRTLSTLVSNLRGAAYRCKNDQSWTILFVSKGIRKITGYPPNDFLEGKIHFGNIISSEDRQDAWEDVQTCLSKKRQYQLVYRVNHANGNVRWVWDQGQGVYSSEGKFVALEGFLADITEQKLAEYALRESEERLRAIVNTAVEAILTINQKGIVQSYNPAAETMFGYPANEVIGQNVRMLMPSPYREKHDHYIQAYLKTGEKKIIGIGREAEGQRKDGTIFPIHLSVAEVDHLGLFTGVIRDLSEEKKAEKELEKARGELMMQTLFTQRLSALATMAGGIAHELNQPLSSIGLYAATICKMIKSKETVDTSKIMGSLDAISKQVSRASKIIDHMRDFASENKKIGNHESNIHQAIDSVLMLTEQQLHNHNIGCSNEVDPELKVKIDRTRLEQVLVILISNAKDSIDSKTYPPKQNGIIRFSSAINKESTILRIHDNGRGIHDDVRKKIFEPFVTTKDPGKGTGLGLSICHGILKDYSATIEVEETNSSGTTFKLSFLRGK